MRRIMTLLCALLLLPSLAMAQAKDPDKTQGRHGGRRRHAGAADCASSAASSRNTGST